MSWMSALGVDALVARYRAHLGEGALALEDRVTLARLEWAAQKKRLQAVAVLGVLLGGLTIVALMGLSLAVVVHFWDSPLRTTVAWVVAGVWLVLWAVVLYLVLRLARHSTRPFALTRVELARDWNAFKEKL